MACIEIMTHGMPWDFHFNIYRDANNYHKHTWIFHTLSEGVLELDERCIERDLQYDAYIPTPFLEHLLDDHKWRQILTTLDICAQPQKTQFYDEDGYDMIPMPDTLST